jgi:hypothetical protein
MFLREDYERAMDLCIDEILKKQTIDEYGTEDDPLKSMHECGIDDLGSYIKFKGIRLKNSTNKKVLLNSAIDIINYAVDVIRRLEK